LAVRPVGSYLTAYAISAYDHNSDISVLGACGDIDYNGEPTSIPDMPSIGGVARRQKLFGTLDFLCGGETI
jgi:hypothetical protein